MKRTGNHFKCITTILTNSFVKSFLCIFLSINFSISAFTQYENVVINESSGDGGNIEAGNDAIVEIAGPSGTDIGCMVITNTEWAIVLPAGTKIPNDGVFSIGCEERDNKSTGFYTGLSTGLSCDVCDFPGLVVDFDVCNAQNASYVSTSVYSTYGFTLDNQAQEGNRDGDQVILFRPDGTPHDAIYWGGPEMTNSAGGNTTVGGASGNTGAPSDHVSVQINHPYTLGDNDENGIINDYTGTHIGYRANGKNAIGVNIMPNGNDDLGNPELFGNQLVLPPGDCNADKKKYTVPALSNPVWVNVGLNLVSCNSTHIRLNDTSPIGNSHQEEKSSTTSSHKDDPDLNADWQVFGANDLIPSSINPDMAASQWQITNHPNPGKPNDADSWDFFYNIGEGNIEITAKNVVNISLCNAQSIIFGLRVYNYQHVEPSSRSTKLAGSFIRDESGIDQEWEILQVGHQKTVGTYPSNNDGVTIFKFTSNILENGTTNSFTLVWDDYTDCCGSGSNNTVVNQAIPHECYEKIKVNIQVAEAVTISDTEIDCPEDFITNIGLIDFSDFISSPNALVKYHLKEQVIEGMETITGTIIASNSTGIFNLPTTLRPPLALVVEDLANCGATQIIKIGNDCRNAPPCPEPKGASISKTTVCPTENFTLSLDAVLSTDLPNGGTVDWYYGTAGFDPFDENQRTLLGKSEITTTDSPTPTTGPALNEVLVDARQNDGNGGEFIEIAGIPGTDLSCFILTDGDDDIILPMGTTIPTDGFLLIASGTNANISLDKIDVNLDNCDCFSDPTSSNGAADLQFTNASATNGEFLFFYNATGTFLQGILWGNPSNTNSNHPDAKTVKNISITPDGCTPPAMITRSGQSFVNIGITSGSNGISYELDTDVTGNWQLTDDGMESTPGTSNTGILPTTSVSNFTTNLGSDLCNQTIEIKGIIQPASITNICSAAQVSTAPLALTIICPKAALQTGDKNLCLPIETNEVLATANLTGGSGRYNVEIQIINNGLSQLLTKNNVQNPLQITYADLITTLGKNAFLEAELSIKSISDADGKMCSGEIEEETLLVTVQEGPNAIMTASSDLSDCSGLPNGSITLEFSPTNSGPWEFEYTINDSENIAGVANITPFELPVANAGTYQLKSVISANSCKGRVGYPFSQTVNPPTLLSINEVGSASICNKDAVLINLDTEIAIAINDNGTLLTDNAQNIGDIIWFKTNPTFLPLSLRPTIRLTPTTFKPVSDQAYFFIYKRPSDGCEVIGQTAIYLNHTSCLGIFPWNGNN